MADVGFECPRCRSVVRAGIVVALRGVRRVPRASLFPVPPATLELVLMLEY